MQQRLLLSASLSLLFCSLLSAQDIQWEKSYGGRQADYLSDVLPTADYGFILAGSSLSQKSGNKLEIASENLDFWIWKMDENGKEDWQKSFGGEGSDFLTSIKITNDGGFILGGTSNSTISTNNFKGKTEASRGGNDYWLIKLDAKGNEQWQRTLGGSGQDDLTAVILTRDGGYIAAGSSSSQISGDKSEKSRGNMDYWLIKLDKDGKTLWQKTIGGKYADLLRTIEPTDDGGFIVGGYSNSPSGGTISKNEKEHDSFGQGGDFWILKLDKNGGILWQQTIGGEQDEQLFSLHQTYDKGYVIGGSSSSGATGNKNRTNKNGIDIWLVKLDIEGDILWQETYDFGKSDVLTSIVENDDHTMLLGGYARKELSKNEEGIDDFMAIKITDKGEELWRRTLGSDGEDILSKVIETRDGGYLLAGTSNPERTYYTPRSQGKNKSSLKFNNSGGNIESVDKAQNEIDSTVNEKAGEVNQFVDDKVSHLTEQINNAIPKDPDSRMKVGVNGPTGNLLNPTAGAGKPSDKERKANADKGPKQGIKAGRDKKTNYGNRDFWVVKLKDKDKKEKIRATLEAFPNPTVQYTNVVVGFEYDKGSLSVFDLNGRQLQQFAITERTVPVSLSGYPEGVYIISIKTDNGDGSLKIIKGIQ